MPQALPQSDRPDWSHQFESLLSSPLGKELLRTLKEDVHDNIVRDAQTADSMEKGYGLLNQAGGVIKAIEHLQFLSVVPKDEGSRDTK